MAGTLDSCPLNRGVRLIGVFVERGSTVVLVGIAVNVLIGCLYIGMRE